jgi:RhtB (resistance to homoserine/threonine) family protein
MHTQFLTIAIIALLGAISPGPDFAVVIKNALQDSRRAGYFTALGIASGLAVHVTYCLLGIGLLIKNSPFLFHFIQYIGAAYLIYLGLKAIASKMTTSENTAQSPAVSLLSGRAAFLQGFLTNLLNPKCIIFILSVFTLVVNIHTPPWAQIIYGLELVLIAAAWFLSLTAMITHPRLKIRLQKIQPFVVKGLGVFLILLGLHIFFIKF